MDFKIFPKFLTMVKDIVALDHTELATLERPKLKTLVVHTSLEIITICACFDHVDQEFLVPVLINFAKSSNQTLRNTATACFMKLVEKDKITEFLNFPGVDKLMKYYPNVFTAKRRRKSSTTTAEVSKIKKVEWVDKALSFKICSRNQKRDVDCELYSKTGTQVRKHVFDLSRMWYEREGANFAGSFIQVDELVNQTGHVKQFMEFFEEKYETRLVKALYKGVNVRQVYLRATETLLTLTDHWANWIQSLKSANNIQIKHFEFCIETLFS